MASPEEYLRSILAAATDLLDRVDDIDPEDLSDLRRADAVLTDLLDEVIEGSDR
jgi:hypothetical protein